MNAIKSVGLIGLLILPGAVQALDWTQDWSDWEVRPRIGTGVMQYQFEQETLLSLVPASSQGATPEASQTATGDKTQDSLLFAEAGVSVFIGNFFIDLAFQKSGEGEDDFSQTIFGVAEFDQSPNPELGIAFQTQEESKREIDRQDFSLSAGYAITDRLGVFAGYKKNETNFTDRGGRQTFFALTGELTANSTITGDSEFDQDGFFLGATYVWPFESEGWLNGALSFDLGVAFLDGDLTRETDEISVGAFTGTETRTTRSEKLSGEAVGFNLGIAWSGPLTERLSYSLGMDGYQYNYDGENGAPDFVDTLLRVSVGISYALGAN